MTTPTPALHADEEVTEADIIEVFSPRQQVEVLVAGYPDVNDVIEVQLGGPKGDKGDPGPQGVQGVKGLQGDIGDQGPPGYELNYRFATPTSQWVITHNLGTNPTVTVLDLYDQEFSADVSYPDKNTVVIDFAVPFAGVARLRA